MKNILVILALLLCLQTNADDWTTNGNYSISWYNKNQKEFNISSSKELAGVAFLLNNGYTSFDGVTLRLTSDISLSGLRWNTMGLDSHGFKGVFDGDGHTISGVLIVRQSGNQSFFGFFGLLERAIVRNVRIEGVVNIEETTDSYGEQYVGGIAAKAKNSTIEHCQCGMTVSYDRKQTNCFSYRVYVGGILGESYDSNILYCSNQNNVKCTVGSNPKEYYNNLSNSIGGIVGEANRTKIKYCENIANSIEGIVHSSTNVTTPCFSLGGIAGFAGNSYIDFCKSISSMYANSMGASRKNIHIGGIVGYVDFPSIINCYTAINKITASGTILNLMYGGIYGNKIGDVYSFAANFSASDMIVNCEYAMSKILGEDGSTAYTSSGMKSENFLDDLNVYSFINLGSPIWTSSKNGYPCIVDIYVPSNIENMIMGKQKDTETTCYSLFGHKKNAPIRGIYIKQGKKYLSQKNKEKE